MSERTGRSRKLGSIVTIAGLLVLGAGATRAEERGACYWASIAYPILLPDDSLHPAGPLRICTTRRLSPVEWLQATYVGKDAVGAFRGRESRLERAPEPRQPEFVFRREPDGSLRLLGLTTWDPTGATLYRFIPAAKTTLDTKPPHDSESGLVLLVAARQ